MVVWTIAAGIVALVTGIMWGAKSDVSVRAVRSMALKALPVLVLGGFTSDARCAIVGGLIIGIGEKAVRDLLGPGLIGGGTEGWFAYMHRA